MQRRARADTVADSAIGAHTRTVRARERVIDRLLPTDWGAEAELGGPGVAAGFDGVGVDAYAAWRLARGEFLKEAGERVRVVVLFEGLLGIGDGVLPLPGGLDLLQLRGTTGSLGVTLFRGLLPPPAKVERDFSGVGPGVWCLRKAS